MKYILMMNVPRTAYDSFGAWPKKDIEAHIGFMIGLNKALRGSGELVSAEGLADPKEAKIVRAGNDGAPRHPPPVLAASKRQQQQRGKAEGGVQHSSFDNSANAGAYIANWVAENLGGRVALAAGAPGAE